MKQKRLLNSIKKKKTFLNQITYPAFNIENGFTFTFRYEVLGVYEVLGFF